MKTDDPFFYKNPEILMNIKGNIENKISKWDKYINKLNNQIQNARKFSIELNKFFDTYTPDPGLPAWAICEILTLGQISEIFSGLKTNLQNDFIKEVYPDIDKEIFSSFLKTICSLRNLCAHHNQIIGRSFTEWRSTKPKVENEIQEFFARQKSTTPYIRFAILQYFLILFVPPHDFKTKLNNLLKKHSIQPQLLGIHKNWQKDIVWNLY